MPKNRTIGMYFPLGGLNRRGPQEQQPPYTTPDCMNVRPRDVYDLRERGGSRPGLMKAFPTRLGDASITGTVTDLSYEPIILVMGATGALDTAGQTLVQVDEHVFEHWNVGEMFKFDSGSSYKITQYVSNQWILIEGDAEGDGESDSDTFTISIGSPVRLLSSVTPIGPGTFQMWKDDFSGSAIQREITGEWGDLPIAAGAPPIPIALHVDGQQMATNYDCEDYVCGAARNLISLDDSKPYYIEMDVRGADLDVGQYYEILLRMDDTTPAYADSVLVSVCPMPFNSSTMVRVIDNGGSTTTSYHWSGLSSVATILVIVDGDTLKVSIDGTEVVSRSVHTAAGRRFGFRMIGNSATPILYLNSISCGYHQDISEMDITRPMLVAASGGVLYQEATGELKAVSTGSDLTVCPDRVIHAAEYLGLLYIADYDDVKREGNDGLVSNEHEPTIDGAGRYLDSPADGSDTNWLLSGISIYDDVCTISGGGNGVTPVVAGQYTITALINKYLTLSTDFELAWDTGVTYSIQRCPKKFDPITGTLSLWRADSGKGTIPLGCPCICTYMDRIVLAGPDRLWYMSRQRDPLDWDFGADPDDSARAIAGYSSSAGIPGQPIKALIPYGDDYLLFACTKSLWLLRGDPAYDGYMGQVSDEIGVVDKGAWCNGPESQIVLLSHDGLYVIPPGVQGVPQAISKAIPDELRGLDTTLVDISIGYDPIGRGIEIIVCPKIQSESSISPAKNFWFDWDRATFWPTSFRGLHEPAICAAHALRGGGDRSLLFGGRDGIIRHRSRTAISDDGYDLNSYVVYGPFRASQGDVLQVLEMIGTLAESSGDVTWEFYSGDSVEEALAGDAVASGTFEAGRNYSSRPRVRGGNLYLKLSSANAWAIEAIDATVKQSGKIRKR